LFYLNIGVVCSFYNDKFWLIKSKVSKIKKLSYNGSDWAKLEIIEFFSDSKNFNWIYKLTTTLKDQYALLRAYCHIFPFAPLKLKSILLKKLNEGVMS